MNDPWHCLGSAIPIDRLASLTRLSALHGVCAASFGNWSHTVMSRPLPTSYSLVELTDVLTPAYFPNVSDINSVCAASWRRTMDETRVSWSWVAPMPLCLFPALRSSCRIEVFSWVPLCLSASPRSAAHWIRLYFSLVSSMFDPVESLLHPRLSRARPAMKCRNLVVLPSISAVSPLDP